MAVEPTKVEGKDVGEVMLYAISTCGWCRKTKAYLKDNGIGFHYIDVDLLEGKDMEEIMKEVTKWNPRCSFPTVVIHSKKCIVGFDEAEMAKALKK